MTALPPTPSAASTTLSWSPLLEGGLADQAITAVLGIAGHIVALEESAEMAEAGPSLWEGWAGLALLFAYLEDSGLMKGGLETAVRFQERAAEALGEAELDPTLANGFTGVAWAEEHLEQRFTPLEDREDRTAEIDEALVRLLRRRPWQNPFDLAHGLVGLGVYGLERVSWDSGREVLGAALDALAELALQEPEGIAWFTPAAFVPDYQKPRFPGGYYNLGVAHGVPGVAGLLAAALPTGVRPDLCRTLLTGAVTWILAHRLPSTAGSAFPSFVVPGEEPSPTRLAWCYGDPGVAAVLLAAARALDRPDWEREALAVARAAAARPAAGSLVHDACVCHGAAGVGHLFNRFFQATGEEAFREAARYWLATALRFRQEGQGVGGFLYHTSNPERPQESYWHAKPGVLEGAAGVALALTAAVTSTEPSWDRSLLATIPSPRLSPGASGLP